MSLAAPPRVSLHDWETTWSLDNDAYELVAGVPTMTPPETAANIDAAMLIRDRLTPVVGTTHRVLPSFGVHLSRAAGRDTVRQPDLMVLARAIDRTRSHVEPSQVILVVEVLSPSSIERDWVTKRAEYAAAGIPNYLIVDVRDPAAPQLWLFDRLRDAAAGEPPTYPSYADPTGDGTSVTLHLDGHDITLTAADLADAL